MARLPSLPHRVLLWALCWVCTVGLPNGDETTAAPLPPPKDGQPQAPEWVKDGGWIAWVVIVLMMFW
jgi:hypothetical protein